VFPEKADEDDDVNEQLVAEEEAHRWNGIAAILVVVVVMSDTVLRSL
jgi:hypothetical protein